MDLKERSNDRRPNNGDYLTTSTTFIGKDGNKQKKGEKERHPREHGKK